MKLRKPHILKGNIRLEQPQFLIFFDTETQGIVVSEKETKHTLVLGVAKFVDRRYNVPLSKCEKLIFYKPEEFWDWVENYTYNKKMLYVFAHNTEYDFTQVDGYNELKRRGWQIIFDTFGMKPFIIKARKDTKSLMILDVMNYFQVSIERLGDVIGLPKLGTKGKPFKGLSLTEYCERDVDITILTIQHLLRFLREENLGNFGISIAKIAFNVYRHKFMNHKIYIHTFSDVIERERESYKGGRAECFFIGKITGDPLYVLDINSMYPSLMKANIFPTKFVKTVKHIFISQLMDYMNDYLVIAKVHIKTEVPCVGIREKKLIFPVGEFDAVLTTPELKLVMEEGKILGVDWVMLYEYAPIFVEFVNYFYQKRIEVKRAGNKVLDTFYKTIMNSLYGKFGQRSETWEEVGFEEGQKDEVWLYADFDTNKRCYFRRINGKVERKYGFVEGFDSFVPIASFVTAYGRCALWKYITLAGRDNVYYCDTDSLFVNKQGLANLSEWIDPNRLGYLKVEDKRIVAIYNPKDYETTEGRKKKGVKADAVEIVKDVFEQDQFEHRRTALRKGRLGEQWVVKRTKRISSEYTKGIVGKDGWVMPIKYPLGS